MQSHDPTRPGCATGLLQVEGYWCPTSVAVIGVLFSVQDPEQRSQALPLKYRDSSHHIESTFHNCTARSVL